MHGGVLHAESEGVGKGATFRVTLATVDAPAASNPAQPPSARPRGPLRLLVVDDHEATLTVLTRLLTRDGHQVVAASTMRGALEVAASAQFDVLISDLGLPDGSGLDLMRELRRHGPIPGIALSGYGMEDDVRKTREAGFSAHLVKPVNLDQVRQLLAQMPRRG